jgi:ADP-ribosylglycohydrolase
MATLSRSEYWDRVYACWLGKNCGGTLGAPLEKAFGQDEPFDVDWYPELRAGGIPNDDLEMQLIWLKAVEEQGFDLTARHLAQYWLDYIGYNFDEYGLNKTNLRLGLLPPVSGYYNNWFRDCMGSPIRSEIWACLAPGSPALAVRYAYEDAIVDHAGGEGVWGELFNAAVQSAAFVEHDPQTLLDIGLGYIPPDAATARTVQAARAAHREGADWREARRRVLAAAPHYVAQYAPINIGFQVLGWLYGRDFGDTLCTTVNCGYDTDCTGATVGALLGVLGGRQGLPEKWTAPLGEGISTNESWGGLRHASAGANPVPTTLAELTDRVCTLGARLLAVRGAPLQIGDQTDLRGFDAGSLRAPADLTAALWQAGPLHLGHTLGALSVELDYGDAPVIVPGTPRDLQVRVQNRRAETLTLDAHLAPPAGWAATPTAPQTVSVPAHESATLRYVLHVDEPVHVRNSNRATLLVQPRERPAEVAVPVVLVGARRWLLWGPEAAGDADAGALLDRPRAPEDFLARGGSASRLEAEGRGSGWHVSHAPGNALPDTIEPDWTGVLYARLFLRSPRAQDVRLGVPATCPRKLWLNGRLVHEVRRPSLLRPNYSGDGASYVDSALERGWNDVLIKYARDASAPPFTAHLTLSTTGRLYHGLVDVEWTCLPWERNLDESSGYEVNP